jgi:glyoxylase-like metal-dependent hydrolase (beta-lactamase superfamily II)
MQRGLLLGALVAVGALTAALAASPRMGARHVGQQPPSAAAIQADKIRDHLYVLRGGGGNTAALITGSGVVLIDTKVPGWGQPTLDKLREITAQPVITIINTHTHFDHVGGNVEFPAAVDVVAHANTAKLMREMRPVTGGPEQPNPFKETGGRGLPTRTFTDRMTLGAGNDRIELRYFGRAHTSGDAWVVFPALRVLHAGDAFAIKGIPIVDANNGGSAVDYPQTLARAAALPNIDTVITGHAATTVTMDDLKVYADFNREFVQAVQSAKKAGQTMDDVVNGWKTGERFLKEGYMTPEEYQRVARQPMTVRLRANVEVVWNETKP